MGEKIVHIKFTYVCKESFQCEKDPITFSVVAPMPGPDGRIVTCPVCKLSKLLIHSNQQELQPTPEQAFEVIKQCAKLFPWDMLEGGERKILTDSPWLDNATQCEKCKCVNGVVCMDGRYICLFCGLEP